MTNPLPIAATFSKDPAFWGKDFTPKAIVGGDGARVMGSDGKQYLDWVSALGANLLGYGHAAFCKRVEQQLWRGAGFSLPSTLEERVAEKLVDMLGNHVPGWAPDNLGVRFGKTGTDATTMAVRLARAVTSHSHSEYVDIISCGYHGWADWAVSVTPPAWGIPVPSHVYDCPLGDTTELEDLLHRCYPAAVIMEQGMQDCPSGYYQEVRSLCNCYGALFILDEVVTWPRFGLGGAAGLYGAEPDIICIGKGLGNGLPISAMVGRREYFDWFSRSDPVFVSSTHFGEAVGLAAADAVLDIWNKASVKHLWSIGAHLMDGLKSLGYNVIGHPPRSLLQFNNPYERAFFIVRMRDLGILMNRPNLPNLAHTMEDVLCTLTCAEEVKEEIDHSDVKALMAEKLPRVLFEGR